MFSISTLLLFPDMKKSIFLYLLLSLTVVASVLSTSPAAAQSDPKAFFRSDVRPFLPFVYPRAEHRDGRTYVTFQHTKNDPYIAAYDHEKKVWAPVVRAGDNPLKDNDGHGVAALWLDEEGRIHIIYGCRGTSAMHVRSRKPGDITSWEELPSPEKRCMFPKISRFNNGELMLFYRNGAYSVGGQKHGPYGYKVSKDGGNTWGSFHKITSGEGAMFASAAIGPDNSIHVCLTWDGPPLVGPQDINYVCRKPDGVWRNAEGDPVSLPLNLEAVKSAKIYETGDDQTSCPPSMDFSPDGRLWVGFPSVERRDFVCGVRKPDGPFRFSVVAKGCNSWTTDALLRVESNEDACMYVTPGGSERGVKGGMVHRYRTRDGGQTWAKDREIATDNNTYAAITPVYNAHPDGVILFCNRRDNHLYLWGAQGFVK
jgi:hypothetical protein